MLFAGIDAGSRMVKVVFIDGDGLQVIGSAVADQRVGQEAVAERLFERLLREKGLRRDSIGRIVATGYGREMVTFADTTITEISCHARGVTHLMPNAATVVEIGGQDSKIIRLDRNGRVRDFAMNDRCAAGTGRFLEVVASRLEVGLCELGEMAARSTNPAAISSMCVVFAETEIIGLLARGVAREDIAAGIENAVASRVASLARQRLEQPIVFTGGVALIPGMLEALQSAFGQPVVRAREPLTTGALGAALLAAGA